MSALERRLHEALVAGAAPVRPADDLFERVRDSIELDRRHRRRRIAGTAAAVVGAGSVATSLVVAIGQEGGTAMPWWFLEVLTTAVLVGMALWLGPFIKRFGRAYAADVFHDNPMTGKSYIVLSDIVYYLIFTAYILFTLRFEPWSGWPSTVGPEQLQYEASRVGGILLIIGLLHGLNIVLMPVLGRLFSLNRRLSPATTHPHVRGVEEGGSDTG